MLAFIVGDRKDIT